MRSLKRRGHRTVHFSKKFYDEEDDLTESDSSVPPLLLHLCRGAEEGVGKVSAVFSNPVLFCSY